MKKLTIRKLSEKQLHRKLSKAIPILEKRLAAIEEMKKIDPKIWQLRFTI